MASLPGPTATAELLLTLEHWGIFATIAKAVDIEINDIRTKDKSRIAMTPMLAANTLMVSLADIPAETWKSLIGGTILLDNKVTLNAQFFEVRRATGQYDIDSKNIDKITQSQTVDGELSFTVKRQNGSIGWVLFEDMRCDSKVMEFYRANPLAPHCFLRFVAKRGPMQKLKNPGKTGDDTALNGHIAYAQYFVDCTDTSSMYKNPSTRNVQTIVEAIQYYASKPPSGEVLEHRRFCTAIDNQPGFGNAVDWTPLKSSNGLRKHFARSKKDPNPVPLRLTILKNEFIPDLLAKIAAVAEKDMDKPFPYPLVEVGYTAHPYHRREEHRTHVGTKFLLALFEEIAAHCFSKRVFKWQFVTIAECRVDSDRWNVEGIFSRLLQSYSWLGGFNYSLAGFATKIGDEDSTTPSNKQILVVEGHKKLAFMDFNQIEANIAADKNKLAMLQSSYKLQNRLDIARGKLAESIPGLEHATARLEQHRKQVVEIEEGIRKTAIADLNRMRAGLDARMAEVEELEKKLELLDLANQWADELEEEERQRNA